MASLLFERIAHFHGNRPWGEVLDAGSGEHSIKWLASLPTQRLCAVTGDATMARNIKAALGNALRPQDSVVMGNWQNASLLAGEQFDTVLADYLLGAIEGFAPYWQDQLFSRLHTLTRERLYVTGLEPYVPFSAHTEAGQLVVEMGRFRDACLLLAGERPYREYPMEWACRSLRQAGFRIVATEHWPIRYAQPWLEGQLRMCRQRLLMLADRQLATAMQATLGQLEQRLRQFLHRHGSLAHGADYVIAADPLR